MKKKRLGLCLVLLSASLCAKTATQWSDLNQTPTPNPTNITVFEDSTLNLTINSSFIKNNGAYSGDVVLNHNLLITANVLAVDNAQGSALQSSIYKNFTTNTTKSITGQGLLDLKITGDKQAKSLFEADHGGNILISAPMNIGIKNGLFLFSVFRAGQGSTITFDNSLNIDISQANGGFSLQGMADKLKTIFDISQGSVLVNSNGKKIDTILKGDIFSSGTLKAKFLTKNSNLDGKIVLRDSSNTQLDFDGGSTAKIELDLANLAEVGIGMDNSSRIDGKMKLMGNSKGSFTIKNNSIFSVNASFDENAQSIAEILGGEWEGDIEMAGNGVHKLTLKDSGVFIGNIYLLSNAKYTLDSNHSRIGGSITLRENSFAEILMNMQNQGEFDLSLTQNAKTDFQLTQTSDYRGKIMFDGNSQGQIIIDSNANFSSQIIISNSPIFSIQMQGNSTTKAILEFAKNATPKQSQIIVDNAKFLGSILQDNLDYGQLNLRNGGIWYIQASSKVNVLNLANDSSVDFRTINFDENQLRNLTSIDANNRLILQVQEINGSGGTFNLYGILNRNAWGKDANGGIIATDKILTKTLSGTHNIKIFWDINNLDTSLLQTNLYDDHIVVAEQNGMNGGGEFIGAMSDVGVYQYQTKLTKIEKKDENGNVIGYEWILGEEESTPEPPPPPPPPPPPTPDPDPQPPSPPQSQPIPQLSDSAKLINTLLASQDKIWHFQAENLHARLGDLRNILTSSSVWAKAKYGLMLGEEDSEFIASKQMNTMLSFGADYNFYTPYGRNFIGGRLDVSFYQDYGGEFGGVVKSYEGLSTVLGISVYDTFLFHNGFYIDSVLKYFYSYSEFWIGLDELSTNAPKFSQHGLVMSIETGKKFRLPILTPHFNRSFYYLKPEIGASLGYLAGKTFEFEHKAGYSLHSSLSSSTPFQLRFGLDFGRRFDSEKVLGDVFLNFGGEYTALSKGEVKISTTLNEVTLKSKGLFNLKLGVGGNVIFNNLVRLYFDVDSKFLGYIQPVLNLNVGVKIKLGERVNNISQSNEINQTTSTPKGAEYIYLN